jgi:hypothetical protein
MKKEVELVSTFIKMLKDLGIEKDFRDSLDVDGEMESKGIKSDLAFYTLEKKLNELGFNADGTPLTEDKQPTDD